MSKRVIYVLSLENNKYYVGSTKAPSKTSIEEHFKGNGNEWTNSNKPIKVLEEHDGDSFDEDKYVIKFMSDYGIDNVRGGSYTGIVLTLEQHVAAYKAINHANNVCLICGIHGHKMDNCTTLMCFRCGRNSHLASECYAKTHALGGRIDGCVRCGRSDHWAIRCNRTLDIFGRKIESKCNIM